MAVRTTETAVKGIVEVDPDIPLAPFIETANALVTEVCATVVTYDATRLELIERWLSAHFYCVRDPRSHWSAVGPISDRFESNVRFNLSITRYGQQALALDTAGGLALLSRTIDKGGVKTKVGVTWLGSEPDVEVESP